MKLSLQEARRLILACQGLDGGWRLPSGKEGAARAVERLGFVQLDTIAVIERAHHHTLWVRRSDYRPTMLDELLAEDRRVFEYWTAPAAAYVPMIDYRWYLPRMRRVREGGRWATWRAEHADVVRHVLGRIEREGALGSSDFEALPGTRRGTWWDWKPAKMALEALFGGGELMISSRRKFERRYDLAERVLPRGLDVREPDLPETHRFGARRYLALHGLAAARDLRWGSYRRLPPEALRELMASGEVVRVDVEGLDEPHYALKQVIDAIGRRKRRGPVLHLLSPFDSVAGDRGRLLRFFDFDYRIECYVPQAKRRYGYFCLPIVWGDRFVGRLDSKADRKARRYIVHGLHLEPGIDVSDGLLPNLADTLWRFAAFNGCDEVVVTDSRPRGIRQALIGELHLVPPASCVGPKILLRHGLVSTE